MNTLRASLFVLVLTTGFPATAASVDPLVVARFSALAAGTGLPAEWRPLTFRNIDRTTQYRLVEDAGTVVVRADSRKAASGLISSVKSDPAQRPLLEWRWKVEAPVPGVVGRRDADDFAARIYVGFARDPDTLGTWERLKVRLIGLVYGRTPPLAVLNYVWADREPVGTVAASPYTDRVRLVVVESGSARAGEWVAERRDLAADYRRAFGGEPPPVTDIGIMTDTDGTGAAATAFYGDMVLAAEPAATQ